MQLRIALIAATLAVVAGILVLVVSVGRNDPTERVIVEAAGDGGQGPSLPAPIGEPPELDFDPLWDGPADLDEAAVDDTVARIRARMLESIKDDFEASIEEDFKEMLEPPGEANERLPEERRP
jgi:hypothetical protein